MFQSISTGDFEILRKEATKERVRALKHGIETTLWKDDKRIAFSLKSSDKTQAWKYKE